METSYISALDQQLLSVPSGAPLIRFLQAAVGAFPTLVVERLRHLSLLWTISGRDTAPVVVEQPELHPLDYEWLFDQETINFLTEWINDRSAVLIGLPKLASHLRGFTLIERNPFALIRLPTLLGRGQVEIADIAAVDTTSIQTKEVVAFDPPWYLGETLLWLARAVAMVKLGGYIGFSLFPEGLRPAARNERQLILSAAESVGHVEVYPGALGYSTPLFEVEALRTGGCPPLVHWRRGDFVVVHVNAQPQLGLPINTEPLRRDTWASYRIKGQVVKLRGQSEDVRADRLPPRVVPISSLTDWRYPTVSLRDRTRGEIDIWTSRNRVARVVTYSKAQSLLKSLENSSEPAREFRQPYWLRRNEDSAAWMELLDL